MTDENKKFIMSVGGRVTKSTVDDNGNVIIHRMELMEVSLVPVPPDYGAVFIKVPWWRKIFNKICRWVKK